MLMISSVCGEFVRLRWWGSRSWHGAKVRCRVKWVLGNPRWREGVVTGRGMKSHSVWEQAGQLGRGALKNGQWASFPMVIEEKRIPEGVEQGSDSQAFPERLSAFIKFCSSIFLFQSMGIICLFQDTSYILWQPMENQIYLTPNP